MPVRRLEKYLDSRDIPYMVIRHSKAYTAQEVAHAAHVPGKELAKTVMVKIDDNLAMAVLPAIFNVDFELLREASGAKVVMLAGEEDFQQMFPECEIGSMPPFGNLYGIETYVAQSLVENEDICFSAGSHSELVQMKFRDFQGLVEPKVARISRRRRTPAGSAWNPGD